MQLKKKMTNLIMMRGLPASGKSTHAKEILEQGGWVRVNRDLLREMLHFNKWTGKNESRTVEAEKLLVKNFLSHGMNVIVDDTNMGDRHADMWRDVATKAKATFAILEKGTDFETCMIREIKRQKVGADVVVKMALQYEKYPKNEKPFILCDIDGTIADCSHRLTYLSDPKNKDWKGFFNAMGDDTPIQSTLDMLREYQKNGYKIIFLTARPEDYRQMTQDWVFKHTNIYPLIIIMRNSGDSRPDTIVKQQMFETYFKDKYEVETMIDDRPSVIRMWKEIGVPVIDVGKGIEF